MVAEGLGTGGGVLEGVLGGVGGAKGGRGSQESERNSLEINCHCQVDGWLEGSWGNSGVSI